MVFGSEMNLLRNLGRDAEFMHGASVPLGAVSVELPHVEPAQLPSAVCHHVLHTDLHLQSSRCANGNSYCSSKWNLFCLLIWAVREHAPCGAQQPQLLILLCSSTKILVFTSVFPPQHCVLSFVLLPRRAVITLLATSCPQLPSSLS